jgi:hypothetical protein
MKPSKLKGRFERIHEELVGKYIRYLKENERILILSFRFNFADK